MEKNTFLRVVFTTCIICIKANVTVALPILPILSTVNEVISFGKEVYSFIDCLLGCEEEKPEAIDYERIINNITERMNMATETIVFQIELQSLLSDLRDTALIIKQLLKEMESVIKENDEIVRDEYKKRFRDSFNMQKSDVYKIESLLTFHFDVSGLSNTLLAHVTKGFDCGMKQLDQFQNYYMTLVSDVVALALFYERVSDENNLYNQTLASWKETTNSLFVAFENQKQDCKAQLVPLAKKDFDSFDDANDLFENNQYRYAYMPNSVYVLSGTYCVRNLKSYDKIFDKENDDNMIFALFIDNETAPHLRSDDYKKIALNRRLEDCETDTDNIIYSLNLLGYDLIFSLMFQSSQRGNFQILQDKRVTVIEIDTEVDGSNYTTIVFVKAQNVSTISPRMSEEYNVQFENANAVASATQPMVTVTVIFGCILIYFHSFDMTFLIWNVI